MVQPGLNAQRQNKCMYLHFLDPLDSHASSQHKIKTDARVNVEVRVAPQPLVLIRPKYWILWHFNVGRFNIFKRSSYLRFLVLDDSLVAFIWIWIWIVSRQGPVLEHHTDEELCVYGAPHLISWLLNCAEESAATTD